ncbi:hypothetical protein TVAG_024340 [Trichomonas vaginalis G3]|uniref:Uncharacterized protein n=1 Tax=Trichomonas vaginalis (strain ATCC PRA-98 / G3) TaxID=412133 RepID=A2FM92_TRIV3|nr:hypothetical protein TVAGG3_0717050 [Trichomonas vaginalis G3]EAX93990.1 hypothetical protein TVAG_024340 [Trichomonas vaginalis G3]KAI5510325.1 hypothetical protein TVAGG3_0717050 [Trichomonas vaginalis G3]|eukprot:XP_001306920.1 hypothetical protein [Trichomonas vaginalis G3]
MDCIQKLQSLNLRINELQTDTNIANNPIPTIPQLEELNYSNPAHQEIISETPRPMAPGVWICPETYNCPAYEQRNDDSNPLHFDLDYLQNNYNKYHQNSPSYVINQIPQPMNQYFPIRTQNPQPMNQNPQPMNQYFPIRTQNSQPMNQNPQPMKQITPSVSTENLQNENAHIYNALFNYSSVKKFSSQLIRKGSI